MFRRKCPSGPSMCIVSGRSVFSLPPEPTATVSALAPPAEPDISAMSVQEFAQYRAEHGLNTGDFLGVPKWSYRHLPTNNE